MALQQPRKASELSTTAILKRKLKLPNVFIKSQNVGNLFSLNVHIQVTLKLMN